MPIPRNVKGQINKKTGEILENEETEKPKTSVRFGYVEKNEGENILDLNERINQLVESWEAKGYEVKTAAESVDGKSLRILFIKK